MKVKSSILSLVFVAMFYLCCCLEDSANKGGTSTNTPQQMFEYIIESPVPLSVTNLEGTGDTWQGYQIYLRFHVKPEWMNYLIKNGYNEELCNKSNFALPHPSYDIFTNNKWVDTDFTQGRCFTKHNVANKWTGQAVHYFHINAAGNIVHFRGIGS